MVLRDIGLACFRAARCRGSRPIMWAVYRSVHMQPQTSSRHDVAGEHGRYTLWTGDWTGGRVHPWGMTLRPSASSGGLLVMARSTSCLGNAWASAVDVCAAAGCEKSTSASCRATGVLRWHCAPTRCGRSTLRSCGADERSNLDRPRPGPSPPHLSAGFGCPGPHGGARGGRSNDAP